MFGHRLRRCTFAAAVFSALSAHADPPTPEQIAAARTLGSEGVELATAGKCADAIPKLTRAEALFHAPTTAVWLGECQINTGKIVAGTETLNRLARETLPTNAPPVFRESQERAKRLLAQALPKIAELRVTLDAPPSAKPEVKVDGAPLPAAMIDVGVPTDPGAHRIDVTAPGFVPATTNVTLGDGESRQATLRLEVDPNASTATAAVSPSPAVAPAAERAEPKRKGRDYTVPIVLAGVGVVGLGMGTLFGALASGTQSDLDAVCVNKACPRTAQSDIDALDTQTTVSTVAFVVGGVALAAAGVLLFVPRGPARVTAEALLGGARF